MRKSINQIGGILILILLSGLLLGAVANNVHEKYNEQRTAIVRQCEEVLPILTRRYQAFIPLLELCQKQDGWDDSFAAYVEEAPPAFIQQADPQPDETDFTTAGPHERRRFLGRIREPKHFVASEDGDYSDVARRAFGVGWHPAVFETNADLGLIIIDFTELRDGIARFTTGISAFERVMGATEIEPNLPPIITVATNFDSIKNDLVIARLNADLVATDPSVMRALATIQQTVRRYNSEISRSHLARLMGISPIRLDSKLATWNPENGPN